MKVVVFENSNTEKIIEHFIACGYDEYIVFSKINGEYYALNGISVTQVNGFDVESTRDKLLKIRGSLNERFCVVYSPFIKEVDMEKAEKFHKNRQCLATLIEIEKTLCSAIFEPEIFDYLELTNNLEKGALLKIAQDSELTIYK